MRTHPRRPMVVVAAGRQTGRAGVGEFAGSQLGSQRRQILGYVGPQSASKRAAKWHIRPHLALSGDGSSVPSKQRVAGSNPARRANRKAQANGIMRPGIVRHGRPGTGPGTPSARPVSPRGPIPPNSPLRSRTPSSSCRQAVDTRSGSMILNGSSQQCPRSSTMTSSGAVLTALMIAVVIAAAFPFRRITRSAASTDQPAGSNQVKAHRPRNHREDDIGRSGPGSHVCHDPWRCVNHSVPLYVNRRASAVRSRGGWFPVPKSRDQSGEDPHVAHSLYAIGRSPAQAVVCGHDRDSGNACHHGVQRRTGQCPHDRLPPDQPRFGPGREGATDRP
jgi:hypothetical protein